ncbi:MAG: IS21 family transposase [Desulfobacteraceae bacterium]|nr:IS21 family transposase [Desulfobacteraceae bacterium]
MADKEYTVIEIVDVLRRQAAGDKISAIARSTGMDRKTVRKYIRIAEGKGFTKESDSNIEDIAYVVFREVHGNDNGGDGNTRDSILLPHKDTVADWLERENLTLTKVHMKLMRNGVETSYSSLYRFVQEHIGIGNGGTVRMAETEPGEVAEVDFGRLGYMFDKVLNRMRALYALVITLVFSRYQYVHITRKQDLPALIGGIEEAWEFFGGVTRRLIIDNMKAAVVKSNRYEPVFNRTFLEYSQYQSFIIDPAIARHPQGKATVERQIPYVRENFFKGEEFIDCEHAQREAVKWCMDMAGMRIHGTTRRRPKIVFEEQEKALLLPLRPEHFDVPKWGSVTVHPDHHVRFSNALYSLPTEYIGKKVDIRANSKLTRIYYQGAVIKTHPVVSEGRRSTDFEDYPKHKTPYAMRNCDYYIAKAKEIGTNCGSFTEQLLSGDFPWSKLRQAQKLLRLSEKYGTARIEQACSRALSFSLIDVFRLERIIKQALGKEAEKGGEKRGIVVPARFGRPAEYFKQKKEEQKPVWE